jgi:hypothetical protein
MSKRSMQKKVALLQSHFEGNIPQDDPDVGDWSPNSIAENRKKYYEKETPWVLKGMTASEYYETHIKPKQEAQAA